MASLDNVEKAPEKKGGKNKDVELAVRLTIKMLTEGGGMEQIAAALNQSQNPAQVIGQLLAQIVGQLAEKLDEELGIDPRIFLSKGGWLENILDYIEGELGYPPEFSDQIYVEVLETIKAAALGGQQAQQAPQGGGLEAMQPGAPQAPAAPQGQPMGLGG